MQFNIMLQCHLICYLQLKYVIKCIYELVIDTLPESSDDGCIFFLLKFDPLFVSVN